MHDCGLGDVICLEFRGGEWSVVSHYPTHISTYDCRSLYRYLPQVLGYVWEGYRNAGDSSRVVELQEFHETLRAIHGNTGLHPLRSCTWGYLGFICSTEHGSTKDSQNAPQYAFLIFGPEGARQPNDSEFSTWLEEVEETLRFSHRIQRRMGIDTPMFE